MALNRTWNSAVQMAAVPFWHQPFQARRVRWRNSTPVNADPLETASEALVQIAPIEPDGIFDGVHWSPVIRWAVLDIVLTLVASVPVILYLAGGESFSSDEEISDQAFDAAMASAEFLLWSFAVGLSITTYASFRASRGVRGRPRARFGIRGRDEDASSGDPGRGGDFPWHRAVLRGGEGNFESPGARRALSRGDVREPGH